MSTRSKSPVSGGIKNKNEENEELSQAKIAAALGIAKEKEYAAKEKENAA